MPPALSVVTAFAAVPDPRIDRTKKHLLGDILVIALAATISGAESFPAVAAFGRAKQDWLAGFLRLPNGIPSPDTFRRVFAKLDPRAFGACVSDWLSAVCEATGAARVTLVGHSMGGLVSRACMARHGDDRIAGLITIATPHQGSALAALGQGRDARQMERGSDWLRWLGEQRVGAPFVSIRTQHDNYVMPQDGQRHPDALDEALPGVGHMAALLDQRTLALLQKHLVRMAA